MIMIAEKKIPSMEFFREFTCEEWQNNDVLTGVIFILTI